MASATHTHVRIAPQRRTVPARASGERTPQEAATNRDRGWPTDTQVWNWAESAALSGYGPSALSFTRQPAA